jgi:predicted deacylase
MTAKTLREGMQWKDATVGVGAAAGALKIHIGSVGSGNPTALITAGIHGDEGPWGAWAIHKLLEQTTLADLSGTLRVVPCTNPLAMEADARCAPLDVLDLNRVFPGNPKGSHTERLAALLAEHAVDGVDVLIDLHGGGSWCVNAFVFRSADSPELADSFDAPFAVDAGARAATMRGMGIGGYARNQGAKATGVEMGGRSPDEEKWAQRLATGLRRALAVCGVLKPDASISPPSKAIPVKPTTVLRPSQGGILKPGVDHTKIGTLVPEGTLLGSLVDPATFEIIEEFRAPFGQTAMLLLRPTMARLEAGAMTYVVSEPMGGESAK